MLFQFGAIYFALKTKRDGTKRPSRSWLNLDSPSLLRLFDVDSYFLVKLLPLLFEPHIIVFPVYGKPKSAGALLVEFELQDNIVCPKRMIIPYRVQFPRVSVRLHRK